MEYSSKVLIIGIDGGTWDVLGPACEKGWMPNLSRFRQNGSCGTLRSTLPPFTPAAWTALMTGQNPGNHGVIGNHTYDADEERIKMINSTNIRSETLWHKLERHGKKVIVIAVPMTYPPIEVDGVLVSGFETPSLESDFTYPPSFKEEVLAKIPNLEFTCGFRRKNMKDSTGFKQHLNWQRKQMYDVLQMLQMGMEKVDWSVAMVVLRSFDEMMHRFWGFFDFSRDTSSDPRDEFKRQYLQDLDEVLGRFFDVADKARATTVMVSDHGSQAKRGDLYPNRVLRKLGYLKTASGGRLFLRSLQKKWHRYRSGRLAAKWWKLKTLSQAVNLKKTVGYVTEINCYADFNLIENNGDPNKKPDGRQRNALLDEIAAKLTEFKDTDGKPVFRFAKRPAELYGLEKHKPELPDLIIAPRNGYNMRMDVTGDEVIRHIDRDEIVGVHSLDGIFGIRGEGIAPSKTVNAEIVDIAPTVLATLGLPVTEDMNGRVIEEVFNEPTKVEYEKPHRMDRRESHDYSEDEAAEITSRLADLGYL